MKNQRQLRSGLWAILICGMVYVPAVGEELRVGTSADWREWQRPGNAIEISRGKAGPRFVRRNIDAVANAGDFGGGIRVAGSNGGDAGNLIDGSLSSFWAPDWDDDPENMYIEVDLGRVVSARRVVLRLREEGPPLELFQVLLSNGERFFDSTGLPLPSIVRYSDRARYSFNQQRELVIEYGLKPLQFVRIEVDLPTEGAGISSVAVEAVGDNISLGMRERGGQVDILNEIGTRAEGYESTGNSNALIDGDIVSSWRYWGFSQPGDTEFTFDLGALYWVDRVRILGDLAGIAPSSVDWRWTRRNAIHFPWYIIWGSDGSLAPDGSLRWQVLGELPEHPRNLRDIVHFEEQFSLRPLRYLRMRYPNRQCCITGTTAEFQVFGEGYPAGTIMQSPIYDLGAVRNATGLSWQVETPEGTRVEIRSRTGNLLQESYVFHDKNGKEVTERKYTKLIPSFKGRIDTVRSPGDDWSIWSQAYEQPEWGFLSPTPRRFVQLQASLLSDDPMQRAVLDEMVLSYAEPLAAATRAEIYPIQAQPGQRTEFTYYLGWDVGAGSTGFDQLLMRSGADIELGEIRFGGQVLDAEIARVDGGLDIAFADPFVRAGLIELDFASTIYRQQMPFEAFLANGREERQIRQRVDVGDASDAVASEVIAVSLPVGSALIDGLAVSAALVTPNGDGIGDLLRIEFALLNVLQPRLLHVALYDLSGRKVRVLHDQQQTAGPITLSWDGLDESGQLAAPGNYILRAVVQGDAQRQEMTKIIALAY